MPNKRVIYECKYCGKEFENYYACEQCEQSHIRDYAVASTTEIIGALRQVVASADRYQIDGVIMGMPVENFTSLIDETIQRLVDDLN